MDTDQASDSFSGRSRRRLRNFFINPTGHLRFIFAIPTVALLFVIILLWTLRNTLVEYVANFPSNVPTVQTMEMQSNVTYVFGLGIGFVFFALVTVVLTGILISHRYYGPMVPILRTLRGMKEDNYEELVRLRPGDELQELARALNELQDHLRKKGGTA